MKTQKFIVTGVPKKFNINVREKTARYLIVADSIYRGMGPDEFKEYRKNMKTPEFNFELCEGTLSIIDEIVNERNDNTSMRKIYNSFPHLEREIFKSYVSNMYTMKELCKHFCLSPMTFTKVCIEFFEKLDEALNPNEGERELCLTPHTQTR